jgi:hypothetical protein
MSIMDIVKPILNWILQKLSQKIEKNPTRKLMDYELLEEYDFSKMPILPRGQFDPKHRIGTNVIVLDPEIAKAFPNDEAVNEALRLIVKAAEIPHPRGEKGISGSSPSRRRPTS